METSLTVKRPDASPADADYGVIGVGYVRYRQTEPRFETLIAQALGMACRVLNVGAGAGSYEPTGRETIAVAPSAFAKSFVTPDVEACYVDHLRRALDDGSWDARQGVLRWRPTIDGSLRLRTASP